MLKKHLVAAALSGFAAISSAQAADEFLDDRFYVAPFGTYLHGGGDRNGFDGWGGGLAIGKIINEYFNVEIKGYWQEYKGRPVGPGAAAFNGADLGGNWGRYNADLIGGTVDLQYYFFRDTFSPYLVVGVGGQNTSARLPSSAIYPFGAGTSTTSFVFETGLGATLELADNFLLRADVRYRLDTAPSGLDFDRNGFTFANSFNAAMPAPLLNTVLNRRSPDVFNDLLVNVGFVIPFGDKPQPTHVAAAAPVDDCASRDSDHDGVNDCDDKCPNTAKGVKVDSFGCPIKIELKGVNFLFDSAELTPAAKTILDKVATDLIAFPVKKDIEVRGHTSTEGSAAHNMGLSKRRSQSVVDYLKHKGVTNKLIAKGFGEDYPLIYPDKTEAQREKNRRVELVWVGE